MIDSVTRITFKDNAIGESFVRDGYVVIRNFANKQKVEAMLQVFNEIYSTPASRTNIWNTLIASDYDVREKVSKGLMEQLNLSLPKHFEDYEALYAYFLTKAANDIQGEVGMHSDSSSVNEQTDECVVMWLPLVDVMKKNGGIYMIPGSKGLFNYEQPFSIEWPYAHLSPYLKKYVVDLPMNAGDLLLFSGKTIHGSYPNTTNIVRPVVGSGLLHPSTKITYNYYDANNNMVKVYEVDPFFYFRNEYGDPGDKQRLLRTYDFIPPNITEPDIKQYFAKHPIQGNQKLNILKKLGITAY